jgi:protein-disulfide isomerase
MRKLSFRIIIICATLSFAAPLISTAQVSPSPIATVNGQSIYEEDLMSVTGTSLLELQKQEYKLKSDALDKLILQKLVEAEAKKKGLGPEEFLKQEVDSKIAEPSDDEAKGYYLASKSQTTLPFDQIKSQVKRLLKTSEIEEAREKYAQSLRAKADVAILLRPPKVEIGYDAGRVRGNPDAPVTIVEFSDFQCPFSKKVQATLKDLLGKYNGRVKLAYRDFPMRTLHPQAQRAAEAARCAEEKGKFWEYHDALFADEAKLDEGGLIATARTLGMDEKAFQSCLSSGKFKPQIEQDLQDGAKAGVSGTPGFFVNGVFVNGAQPASEFQKIIDNELAAGSYRDPTRAAR